MKIRGIEFRTDIEGLEKTHPPQPSNFYIYLIGYFLQMLK